jgi:hypothetical protein
MSTKNLTAPPIASVEDARWQACAAVPALDDPSAKLALADRVLGEWLFYASSHGCVILSYLLHQTVLKGRLLVSMKMKDFKQEVERMAPADAVIIGKLDVGSPVTFRRQLHDLVSKGYVFSRRMGEEFAIGLYFNELHTHYPKSDL